MNSKCTDCLSRPRLTSVGVFAGLVFFALNISSVAAKIYQSDNVGGREQRSPWRASFTEINQDAVNQSSAPQGWQPVQSRSQDSSSTGSAAVPANIAPNLNIRTADASPTANAYAAGSASAAGRKSAAGRTSAAGSASCLLYTSPSPRD